ncbi:MAG TPA: toll/interleukin-1 receptor domain-containing protein [Mycobacteriales bacterium]|nr:toll/interleukin-1 receptor domain-containing protein [Mycobacteriales bacterium]
MAAIFVSYRNDDDPYAAAHIHAGLCRHFGANQVFRDCVSMSPGTVYPQAIRDALAHCQVLVAVIGRRWLSAADAAGRRRIDDPRDWVRIELATALRRQIRIVPVLLDGAAPPASDELPGEVRGLALVQVARVGQRSLDVDLAALADDLAEHVPVLAHASPARAAESVGLPSTVGPGGLPAGRGADWRVLVAAVVVAVMLGLFGYLQLRQGRTGGLPAPTTPAVSSPASSSPPSDSLPSDSPLATAGPVKVRWQGTIGLSGETDLDQVPPRSNGAGSDIRSTSLYEVSTASDATAIVSWPQPGTPSRDGCRTRLATYPSEYIVQNPPVGSYLCVRTTDGRVARLRASGLAQTGAYELDVTIWELSSSTW